MKLAKCHLGLVLGLFLQGMRLLAQEPHVGPSLAEQSLQMDEPTTRGVLDGDRLPPKKVSFTPEQLEKAKKIKHVIVIFLENWSFDGLYGHFPGVDGLKNASQASQSQIDLMGKPYPFFPRLESQQAKHDFSKLPDQVPNRPYDMADYYAIDAPSGDLVHHFYLEQYQINGGRMNHFALFSDAPCAVMSFYDIQSTAMGKLAKEYVICDRWFHSCYGNSLPAAIWLFSAQMPAWKEAPSSLRAYLLPSDLLVQEGKLTPDGYVIGALDPFYPPYKASSATKPRLPPLKHKHIGDLLNDKGIGWKWYAQGWKEVVEGQPDPSFIFHHQAPLYFENFAPGTLLRERHMADLEVFKRELRTGQVPEICFIRPLDRYSQHPGRYGLLQGLNWCSDLIHEIQQSTIWNDCIIIVTYDENGGRWDHVAPPVVDRFGPATRVPTVIISPFAKRGFIDSTDYETVSILKFIEQRWDLPALSSRDEQANNLLNALDL